MGEQGTEVTKGVTANPTKWESCQKLCLKRSDKMHLERSNGFGKMELTDSQSKNTVEVQSLPAREAQNLTMREEGVADANNVETKSQQREVVSLQWC